jgi:hypothetical protein
LLYRWRCPPLRWSELKCKCRIKPKNIKYQFATKLFHTSWHSPTFVLRDSARCYVLRHVKDRSGKKATVPEIKDQIQRKQFHCFFK